jgi:hypothetical protein
MPLKSRSKNRKQLRRKRKKSKSLKRRIQGIKEIKPKGGRVKFILPRRLRNRLLKNLKRLRRNDYDLKYILI